MFDERFYPNILFEEPGDQGGDTSDEGDTKDPEDILPDADADKLRKHIRELRDENKDRRKSTEEMKSQIEELNGYKETFDKFKNVFGEDEEDLDPEKLKSQTETLESKLKQERVKNKITIQAIDEGADPDLTIAYLQNKGKLSKLDASDDEAVKKAISKAVEEKPNLKNGKAVTTGDSENESGNGKTDLNAFIRQSAAK